jgi:uncharacterized delta-60 repeat protein
VDSTFHPDLPSDGAVNAIVVQTNGNIVIGGSFDSVSGEPIANLARLFSDGTLDDSFGPGTDTGVLDLAQGLDGKIVVSGNFSELQGVPCNGLGRLFADGEVDTDFDTGTLFGPGDTPYKLAVRPDGRILVGTLNGNLYQFTTNGELDATFTQTNVFEGYWAHSMFLETNGDLIVGGGFNSVNGFSSPGWVVLDPSGNLKTNVHSALADSYSDVFTILHQTDGGFLIGGLLKHTNGTANTMLDRLDSNFQPDTNFQTSPFTPLDFNSGPFIRSAILQPDGKIVAGGSFDQVGGYFRRGIVRLDATGKVDPCFDPGIGLGGVLWGANAVTSQPDGRILVGGIFGVPGYVSNNIVRLLPQSECDTIRVYFGTDDSGTFAAGTSTPGGTNHLQMSTNIIDWVDLDVETAPFVWSVVETTAPAAFYRVKKEY